MPIQDFTHEFEQFSANVKDLAGSPMRSILSELVDQDNKKGSIVYLDSAGAGDDLTIQNLKTDKKSRKTYEAEVTKTLAKWNEIHTPHDEITRQRTQSEPKLIEFGHSFDRDEDIFEIVSPQNKVLRQGMRKIWKQEDQLVINGIKEASVLRKVSNTATDTAASAVTFPSSQAFNSANAGYMHRKDMTRIVQMMEDQYVSDMIYCLISPTMKRGIIDNDDKITDSDFLTHAAAFDENGKFMQNKFPEVFGIHFIVHPLIETTKAYAFTRDSIVLNTYKPLESNMGVAETQRFSYVCLIDEKKDCKRVDDLQVIHMTLS